MNIQDWSPLGWTVWISLQSKRLSRIFSNTTVQKHQFFSTQLSFWSTSHIHTWLLEKTQPWLDRPLSVASFKLIVSAKTLFPKRVTFTGIKNRIWISLWDTVRPTIDGKSCCTQGPLYTKIKYNVFSLEYSYFTLLVLISAVQWSESDVCITQVLKEMESGHL